MIINRKTNENIRDMFTDAVKEIFDNIDFLDFITDVKYSSIIYDCFVDFNGENYIINRDTGEFINWYKFSHIGRFINMSVLSINTFSDEDIKEWIKKFLLDFKNSEIESEG